MTVTELASVVAREERIAKGDSMLSRDELRGLIDLALKAMGCPRCGNPKQSDQGAA